jgi:hypothetical protein
MAIIEDLSALPFPIYTLLVCVVENNPNIDNITSESETLAAKESEAAQEWIVDNLPYSRELLECSSCFYWQSQFSSGARVDS